MGLIDHWEVDSSTTEGPTEGLIERRREVDISATEGLINHWKAETAEGLIDYRGGRYRHNWASDRTLGGRYKDYLRPDIPLGGQYKDY